MTDNNQSKIKEILLENISPSKKDFNLEKQNNLLSKNSHYNNLQSRSKLQNYKNSGVSAFSEEKTLNMTLKNPTSSQNVSQSKKEKDKKQKGNYILGKTLGEGAFGKVKVAKHIFTQQQVAIKILDKTKMLDEEDDIIRVQKEISILKKIKHKNIIQLYEIMESKRNLYLVMEYCENKELFDYIVRKQRIEEPEANRFFQEILDGVEYLHSLRIVHRDLKPENLLLNYKNEIKISDFGLSTNYKGLISTPCGTPSYAPPEMLKGDSYSGVKSDIWSLGVILYVMICGALPFQESKEDLILKRIECRDLNIPESVSPLAKDLIEKILNEDPFSRISIKEIKNHPWYLINIPSPNNCFYLNYHKIPIDDYILNYVIKFGVNKEDVISNLVKNKFDNLTAIYYLCLRKYCQGKRESISDFSSNTFYEYLKLPTSVEEEFYDVPLKTYLEFEDKKDNHLYEEYLDELEIYYENERKQNEEYDQNENNKNDNDAEYNDDTNIRNNDSIKDDDLYYGEESDENVANLERKKKKTNSEDTDDEVKKLKQLSNQLLSSLMESSKDMPNKNVCIDKLEEDNFESPYKHSIDEENKNSNKAISEFKKQVEDTPIKKKTDNYEYPKTYDKKNTNDQLSERKRENNNLSSRKEVIIEEAKQQSNIVQKEANSRIDKDTTMVSDKKNNMTKISNPSQEILINTNKALVDKTVLKKDIHKTEKNVKESSKDKATLGKTSNTATKPQAISKNNIIISNSNINNQVKSNINTNTNVSISTAAKGNVALTNHTNTGILNTNLNNKQIKYKGKNYAKPASISIISNIKPPSNRDSEKNSSNNLTAAANPTTKSLSSEIGNSEKSGLFKSNGLQFSHNIGNTVHKNPIANANINKPKHSSITNTVFNNKSNSKLVNQIISELNNNKKILKGIHLNINNAVATKGTNNNTPTANANKNFNNSINDTSIYSKNINKTGTKSNKTSNKGSKESNLVSQMTVTSNNYSQINYKPKIKKQYPFAKPNSITYEKSPNTKNYFNFFSGNKNNMNNKLPLNTQNNSKKINNASILEYIAKKLVINTINNNTAISENKLSPRNELIQGNENFSKLTDLYAANLNLDLNESLMSISSWNNKNDTSYLNESTMTQMNNINSSKIYTKDSSNNVNTALKNKDEINKLRKRNFRSKPEEEFSDVINILNKKFQSFYDAKKDEYDKKDILNDETLISIDSRTKFDTSHVNNTNTNNNTLNTTGNLNLTLNTTNNNLNHSTFNFANNQNSKSTNKRNSNKNNKGSSSSNIIVHVNNNSNINNNIKKAENQLLNTNLVRQKKGKLNVQNKMNNKNKMPHTNNKVIKKYTETVKSNSRNKSLNNTKATNNDLYSKINNVNIVNHANNHNNNYSNNKKQQPSLYTYIEKDTDYRYESSLERSNSIQNNKIQARNYSFSPDNSNTSFKFDKKVNWCKKSIINIVSQDKNDTKNEQNISNEENSNTNNANNSNNSFSITCNLSYSQQYYNFNQKDKKKNYDIISEDDEITNPKKRGSNDNNLNKENEAQSKHNEQTIGGNKGLFSVPKKIASNKQAIKDHKHNVNEKNSDNHVISNSKNTKKVIKGKQRNKLNHSNLDDLGKSSNSNTNDLNNHSNSNLKNLNEFGIYNNNSQHKNGTISANESNHSVTSNHEFNNSKNKATIKGKIIKDMKLGNIHNSKEVTSNTKNKTKHRKTSSAAEIYRSLSFIKNQNEFLNDFNNINLKQNSEVNKKYILQNAELSKNHSNNNIIKNKNANSFKKLSIPGSTKKIEFNSFNMGNTSSNIRIRSKFSQSINFNTSNLSNYNNFSNVINNPRDYFNQNISSKFSNYNNNSTSQQGESNVFLSNYISYDQLRFIAGPVCAKCLLEYDQKIVDKLLYIMKRMNISVFYNPERSIIKCNVDLYNIVKDSVVNKDIKQNDFEKDDDCDYMYKDEFSNKPQTFFIEVCQTLGKLLYLNLTLDDNQHSNTYLKKRISTVFQTIINKYKIINL